ncbi:hypothetical protein AALO_G00098430 [Alosa alosa]|uniref:Uncharacterized protein n=1 Tax=Alosa alosa TaxID=278164 RepID=A0AAV6GWX6_9TELE|nr:hypothetical protein AALO_G00098430 [Alosa alosa]
MPKDDVETRLNDEKQKVLTELQAVFGPDVDYDIMPDEAPSWLNIMTVLLGVLGALTCVSVIHLGITRIRQRHKQRRRDSKEDNPNFWATGIQGMGRQHTTEMQRVPPHMINPDRFYR